MPKPSSADLPAYQLEQAAKSKSGLSSSPLSSPPLASHPSSPFEDPPTNGSTRANGLVGAASSDEWTSSAKIAGRGTVRRSGESEEEGTDDELEDELNDFGYGAPKRRKKKKESLMDVLNSEPPAWMMQTPPAAITPKETSSLGSKRSRTFSSRLRQRFGSTSPQAVEAATTSGPDAYAGLTTLRTSRSAGNLLSSLRGKLSSSTGRSREDLLSSPAVPPTPHELPYSTFMTHRTTRGDSFAPFDPQSISPKPVPPTLKKLHVKDASAAPSSTRDLASFRRDSGPDAPTSKHLGESPIKGLECATETDRMRAFSAPPASPRYEQSSVISPLTPLSPSPTLYATPPVTPTPADFVPPPRTPSAPATLSQAPAIPSKSQKRLSVQASDTLKRLSMLPYINGTPSSGDSVLDPPLSAALATPTHAVSLHKGANGVFDGFGSQDSVVAALLALRRHCMAATAALPVDLAQLDACDAPYSLNTILPSLNGMRDQMRLAADLVDAVVEACEAKQAGMDGSQSEDVGRLVGALLGEDDAVKEE
ncbi:hypothetical protein JCM10296v2_003587 [Rhodotorula toruloides]